jgi:hypothetical protein
MQRYTSTPLYILYILYILSSYFVFPISTTTESICASICA